MKVIGKAVPAAAVALVAAVAGGDIADALSAFEGMDGEGPRVELAYLTKRQVRVPATGAAEIHARLHLTDSTGVHSVQVEYVGLRPAAAREHATPVLFADLMSGTPRDGVWDAVLRVGRATPPGTYAVATWPMDVADNDEVVADLGTFTVLPPR